MRTEFSGWHRFIRVYAAEIQEARLQGFEYILGIGKPASDERYLPELHKLGLHLSFEGSESILFLQDQINTRIPENEETYGMTASRTRNMLLDDISPTVRMVISFGVRRSLQGQTWPHCGL